MQDWLMEFPVRKIYTGWQKINVRIDYYFFTSWDTIKYAVLLRKACLSVTIMQLSYKNNFKEKTSTTDSILSS